MPRRVIIVGVGGVGGWLAQAMVKVLEYKDPGSALVLCDGDMYEQKNFERQVFTEMGNKADVMAAQLQEWHPQTFVTARAAWVVPEGEGGAPTEEGEVEEQVTKITAKELLHEGDIVYATVDNFAARKLIFDEARNLDNVDIFTGGNDEELFYSIYHYCRRDGKDITDHPAEMHAEYVDPPDRNPGQMGCAERAQVEGGTQLIATNMGVAALLLGRSHYLLFSDVDDDNVALPATEQAGVDAAAEMMVDMGLGQMQSFDRRVEIPEHVDTNVLAPV